MDRQAFRERVTTQFSIRRTHDHWQQPPMATVEGTYAVDGRTVFLAALVLTRTSDAYSPRVAFVTAPEDREPSVWMGREVSRAVNVDLDTVTGILVVRKARLCAPEDPAVLDVTMSLLDPGIASTVGEFALNITDVTLLEGFPTQ